MSKKHTPPPAHTPAAVHVSAFQNTLRQLCLDVENLFECRTQRFPFARDILFGIALLLLVANAQNTWLASAPLPFHIGAWLVIGWACFWIILHLVRRFHDIGRSGGMFWAVAIPIWAANRIVTLFHLADKGPEIWWAWGLLGFFCSWSFWLLIQLFFRRGSEGLNSYDGREFYTKKTQ